MNCMGRCGDSSDRNRQQDRKRYIAKKMAGLHH
jgi:hypothetical protein